ncbi:MAG: hypothetical protein NC211_00700, partial [Alistipes senegalensis]|nr:hypothetical protein [Oxalobacter formigenes]MCM1280345.1 hypothetical protein [Alistipes senegalensis]
MIGHYGLRGFFGTQLSLELDNIFFHNQNVREAAQKWVKNNGDYIRQVRNKKTGWSPEKFTQWIRHTATEEALARMAGRGEKVTGVKKLVHAIQKCLRAIGLWQLANRLEAKTDAEALMALHKAELFVRSGKSVDTATVTDVYALFSRKGNGQALPGVAQKESAVDLATQFSQRGEASGADRVINSGKAKSLPEDVHSGKQDDDFIDFFQEDDDTAAFRPDGEGEAGDDGVFDESPDVLYQFIGEKGAAALDRAEEATARLDNLAVAREMEAAGRKAKLIKLATGWERGADGKWRYEISDAFLRLNLPENGKRTLGEVLVHPELFTAYPDLKGFWVVREPILSPAGAAAFLDGETIFVDDGLSSRETADALLHEVQHAIQEREGFARGAAPDAFDTDERGLVDTGRKSRRYVKPDMAYKAVAGEVEARNAQRRAGMTPEQRMYLLAKETEDVARKDQIVLFQAVPPGELTAEEKLRREAKAWRSRVEALVRGGKAPEKPVLLLRQTPLVMRLLGAAFRAVYAVPHVFDGVFPEQKKNPVHHAHTNMTAEVLAQLPEALADPIAVFRSETKAGRLIFLLDIKDARGATVVVPVELDARKNKEEIAHLAVSAYGKVGESASRETWFSKRAGGQAVYINRAKAKRWIEAGSGSHSPGGK